MRLHVRDDQWSRVLMHAYMSRHCPKALFHVDPETLARVHNGGPDGASPLHRKTTDRYWQRVKRQLDQ